MRSVEQSLGSQAYARLRVGIAPQGPIRIPLEEFVLESFGAEEEKELNGILERAAEACRFWVAEPIERAANLVNKPTE